MNRDVGEKRWNGGEKSQRKSKSAHDMQSERLILLFISGTIKWSKADFFGYSNHKALY